MTQEHKLTRVLIVSESAAAAGNIAQVLPADRFSTPEATENAEETRRLLVDRAFDIVIINTPLKDDFGVRLAVDLARYETIGILLLVKSELYEQVSGKVESYGVITLAKPINKQLLMQSVNMLISVRNKMKSIETRADDLQKKMDEVKVVNRAKLLLVEKLKMSEAEAHRFIEKSAMDRCVKRREIAESIIKTYEN